MFIPLENGSVLWMSGVIAIYKTDAKTLALRDDGSCDITSFSPVTLKKRYMFQGIYPDNFKKELFIDEHS